MSNKVEDELKAAVDSILASDSRKKLVIAGPGAGKTTLFGRMLDAATGDRKERLVLTFVNNLKNDLEEELGDRASVFTLHGYCQYLLHRNRELRGRLTADFRCYPNLPSLVQEDWQWLEGSAAPHFVSLMRDLECTENQEAFYQCRADYYDAVGFDDSVHRTYRQLNRNADAVPEYELILIDEFQDFNRMEAAVIELLADKSSIVVAGDDDQALYSKLRSASWDHIRSYSRAGDYEVFYLPFCMRCPEVIVDAVNDVIAAARGIAKLAGRIEKPFRYFEPVKGADSEAFPQIDHVNTTVQRNNANYFGKYVAQLIEQIPQDHWKAAEQKHGPVALVIASEPYRGQIEDFLVQMGLISIDAERRLTEREKGLLILHEQPESNLGWRIVLGEDNKEFARDLVQQAHQNTEELVRLVPDEVKERLLAEAEEVAAEHGDVAKEEIEDEADPPKSLVKVTSYEGAKGLSSQYVILAGVHEGDLPRNAQQIEDIEICRFLVGLTRTKKQCTILTTSRFAQNFKRPSTFLGWLQNARLNRVDVNAEYWKRQDSS